MCGIFALLNYESTFTRKYVVQQFNKGRSRGPENSYFDNVGKKISFGFHRLAINGLNPESNQPLVKGDITLICNGEIYNYKELYSVMYESDKSVIPRTQSDCEVILWLYERYGIEQTLQMLDGVFAFALIDNSISLDESVLYIARDPYGVRPLYCMHQIPDVMDNIVRGFDSVIGFASELKSLSGFAIDASYTIQQFAPGTYSKYVLSNKVCSEWMPSQKNIVYHRTSFPNMLYHDVGEQHMKEALQGIQKYLVHAVEKRCSTTERPIACLLSGGLDSSLIASIVNDYHKRNGLPRLETYSIGLAQSTDLRYARIVADYLGTNHTEIILTEQEFCDAIPEVIYAIESYDTTTVRASIGNYLLGKYIASHSEAKVIFNGDGSDELLGGYLYMHSAPDAIEFDRECRRLLSDIHAFDVLRSDKSISSHGLEPRTPFLDREWTQFYLSISHRIRHSPGFIEKHLLRCAFSKNRYVTSEGFPYLPEEVLWRRKEAFSDGVSGHERSLYQVLQEYCSNMQPSLTDANAVKTNVPKTDEQVYYRSLFESFYPGHGEVVPYFWMPRYVNATDASARTLAEYEAFSINNT
jgi:asparagine synthase (glutamine-hydrolysing)